MAAILYIIGTPLDESERLSSRALKVLEKTHLIIGESQKLTRRFLAPCAQEGSAEVYTLDNMPRPVWKRLEMALHKVVEQSGTIALFADTGMPILFDTGREILERCRRSHCTIRSIPSATSWGTAAALSGYDPPFLLIGFLPKSGTERERSFQRLKQTSGQLVLLETPYRFRQMLAELRNSLGSHREVFVGWELGRAGETLFWGTLAETESYFEKEGLKKGEYVIIVRGGDSRRRF